MSGTDLAITVAIFLGVGQLLGRLPRAYKLAPELLLLATLLGMGFTRQDPGVASLNQAYLRALQTPGLLELALSAVITLGWARRDQPEANPTGTALAALLFGAPAAAWAVASRAQTGARSMHLVVLAVAMGALSPLGGPLVARIYAAHPEVWTWLAPPALALAALAAFLGRGDGWRAGLPPRSLLLGALALGVTGLAGSTTGMSVLAVGVLALRGLDPSPPDLPEGAWARYQAALPLRAGLAAILATVFAHVCGIPFALGFAATEVASVHQPMAWATLIAGGIGLLADPWFLTGLVDRTLQIQTLPAGWEEAFAVGALTSPVPCMALAAHRLRSRAWLVGLAWTLLTLAVSAGWVFFGPRPFA